MKVHLLSFVRATDTWPSGFLYPVEEVLKSRQLIRLEREASHVTGSNGAPLLALGNEHELFQEMKSIVAMTRWLGRCSLETSGACSSRPATVAAGGVICRPRCGEMRRSFGSAFHQSGTNYNSLFSGPADTPKLTAIRSTVHLQVDQKLSRPCPLDSF